MRLAVELIVPFQAIGEGRSVSAPGVSGHQQHDATNAVCVSPIPEYWDSSYNSLQQSAAGGICRSSVGSLPAWPYHCFWHRRPLLHHLECQFGLRSIVLAWFILYLINKPFWVLLDGGYKLCQPRSPSRVQSHKVQFLDRDFLSSIWQTLLMWLINTMWSSVATLTTLRCPYTVSITTQCLPSLI